MRVRFQDAVLERCYREVKQGTRRWNAKVARTYIRRINQLSAAPTVQDIRALPQLGFHPLKGKLAGSFAIDIDRSWRIRLTFADREQTVCIEEVSNHYGD